MKKGITLVGLVVTIVIMLILSAVTITLTIGENGIIRQAVKAGEKQKEAQEKEKNELDKLYSSMFVATNDDSKITISMEDLSTLIDSKVEQKIKTMNVTVPEGTVISYMGNNVPEGYLSCDGTVYNISEYTNLAEQIKKEFGKYNYFGGDGTTTFAVPDLRGEFLRGTGTATRNTGTGANVGIHQEGTNHSMMGTYYIDGGWWIGGYGHGLATRTDRNQDKSYGSADVFVHSWTQYTSAVETGYSGKPTYYTSRPTNTSILYCIKY